MAEHNREIQRLTELYRGMSDAELSLLSAEPEDLSDAAREALKHEMSRRGLALPTPAEPEPALDYAGSVPPVMVGRFTNLHEALLAKGQLDSAGIENSLGDDNMVRMDWFISNLVGGVKIYVKAEDAQAAIEVLSQPIPDNFDVEGVGEYEQPKCQKCQSTDISFESLDKLPTYASMWLNVPIPFAANRWRCHACGALWEGTEDDSTPAETGGL